VRILARLPKVRDYLDWYLDWYAAEHPTTITKARSEVKRFIERFGHRPIDSIRAVEVEQYKRSRLLDDRAAKETVGKEIRRLKAAFNRGVEWKELDVNPLDSVKAPRGVRSVAVKFYDRAAMRRLYRANPARAPLWMFMAHTGVRRGEIIGLRKSSVVAGRLLVESDPDETGAGRTKSGKWREVPINRYAKWALRHLPDPLVSAHKDTVSDWFSKDATEAGVGGHLHRLRHTFCAHMAIAGVPLRRIQLLAGHADYATTEKYYAHLTPEGDYEAVHRLRY
jgi:integrase